MRHRPSSALVFSLCAGGAWLLAGCAKAPLHEVPAPPPHPVPAADPFADVDRRLDAQRAAVGDDITETVRAQNTPAMEPPAPTRKGVVFRLQHKLTTHRTPEGFVVHLPGTTSVATPAHHRGNIVVGGFGTKEIYAFAAATGKEVWGLHLSDDGPTDPACEDGVCVFNTYSCTLFGVDAETGKDLWSWYLGSPQLATPVIRDGLVYSSYPRWSQGTGPHYVIGAFDLKTGKPRWRRWIDAEVNATPVSDGRHLYVATRAGTLYQFSARDGEVVSVQKNRVSTPPVLAGGSVIFGRDQQRRVDNDMLRTSRLLLPTLERIDAAPTPVKPQPRPLVARHGLYTVEHGAVVATNRATGRRMWESTLSSEEPADVPSPLLYAGGSILLATSGGNVLRIEPDTGRVEDAFVLRRGALASQPIAVDGWLYAGTKNGDFVAFDTGDPRLTGWEMLGGGPDRRGAVAATDGEGT